MITSMTRALRCALLATTCIAAPAFAQATGGGTIYKNYDENGVDLTTGSYSLAVPIGSIGTGRGRTLPRQLLWRHLG